MTESNEMILPGWLNSFYNNFPELHGLVNYNLIVDFLPIQYK